MSAQRVWRAASVAVAALGILVATGGTTPSSPAATHPSHADRARQHTFIADALSTGGPLRLRVPSTVTLGAPITIGVQARVRRAGPKAARRRTVVVSVKQRGRWAPVLVTRSDRLGRASGSVPGGVTTGVKRFRVQLTKAPGLAAVTRSFSTSVTRADAPVPRVEGDPHDWTYFAGAGEPGRWDSCQPVRWGYDPAHEYTGAAADLQQAFADLASHTGFTFEQVPFDAAQLTVMWSRAADEPLLKGGVIGAAAPAGPFGTYRGVMEFDSGEVILDYEEGDVLVPGFALNGDRTVSWGTAMHHEILHALGLGHAEGERQVMYPLLGDDNQEFGAGDLAGMSAIGASTDCFPEPGSEQWDQPAPGTGTTDVHRGQASALVA